MLQNLHGMSESKLSPFKIVVACIIFLQLIFWLMYGHHILDYFCLFKVYLISLKLHLINYFEKFNKHRKIWTFGLYLWQNNTYHRVWNSEYILSFQTNIVHDIFWVKFFMMYDIDIHQLNLGNLIFLMKFHSENVFFFICLINECIIIF
jgi:hypothetical protein